MKNAIKKLSVRDGFRGAIIKDSTHTISYSKRIISKPVWMCTGTDVKTWLSYLPREGLLEWETLPHLVFTGFGGY